MSAGIRQFLDLGSGIPTVGHVHEIAQAAAPESRVVFVDIDPVAVAHSRQILEGNERTTVIQEDVRRPENIIGHPAVRQLLDLSQPVAVLVFALLHFIPEADNPKDLLSRLTAPLVSGSFLALSHGTDDGRREEAAGAKAILQRGGITQTLRTGTEVEALFAGWELVDPGVVWVSQWHPESSDDIYFRNPEASGLYGGVARKP